MTFFFTVVYKEAQINHNLDRSFQELSSLLDDEVEVLEQHESNADDSISITEQIDQVMSLFQDQSRPPAALIDFKLEELLDYETMEEDQVLTHYTQVTILMYSNLNVIVI